MRIQLSNGCSVHMQQHTQRRVGAFHWQLVASSETSFCCRATQTLRIIESSRLWCSWAGERSADWVVSTWVEVEIRAVVVGRVVCGHPCDVNRYQEEGRRSSV